MKKSSKRKAPEKKPLRFLCIDEEKDFRDYIIRILSKLGCEVETTSKWTEAKSLIETPSERPDVILMDPLSSEGWLAENLHEACSSSLPVVVVSSSRQPLTIVESAKLGAEGYLCKPFTPEELENTVQQVLSSRFGQASLKPERHSSEIQFIYSNSKMKRIHEIVRRVAKKPVPVFMQGETGVGKEVVARLIHHYSEVKNQPFVKVNCAALPPELTESELFGHTKGAFTSASHDRPGKFEFANGGTIFLDEIGEFSPAVQAKLLQVLQDGTFTRLGSNEEIRVNSRVVAASNINLEEAIQTGAFRRDLFYRLNVVHIQIPPLRERKEDIVLFCDHFTKRFSRQYDLPVKKIPDSLSRLLMAYHWSGNVRELENTIKRYIVLEDIEVIRQHFEQWKSRDVFKEIDKIADAPLTGDHELDLHSIRKEAATLVEKDIIVKTLQRTNWNKSKAAKELRVSYKTLLNKISEYKITPEYVVR